MSEKIRYAYSIDGYDGTVYEGNYDNFEDALADAIEAKTDYEELEIGDEIYVGEIKDADITIYAEYVLEDLRQQAYKDYDESSEGWLEDVKNEHEQILENELNAVFKKWAEKYNYLPRFGDIINIKTYVYDGKKWVKKEKLTKQKWSEKE